jgi:hypothetical protein
MKWILAVLLFTVSVALSGLALAAEGEPEIFLPQSCATGWVAEGKPTIYSPENLYKYINGEAELYMPYGFERAATVLYTGPAGATAGIVANIFKMGSLLDAFGIYGNYRTPTSEWVKVGIEGFVEETELVFYQNRYFVQVMTSGTVAESGPLLLTCATAVAKRLPSASGRPDEVGFLQVSGLVAHSEKYFPEGLLGYKFLGRGLTGEVALKGGPVKALVVLGDSPEAMRRVLQNYEKYLRDEKGSPAVVEGRENLRLAARDPLYKSIMLQQSGRYIAGVVGLADTADGEGLIKSVTERLPKQ